MNRIGKEIQKLLNGEYDGQDHSEGAPWYGMPRRSGRYPWGSGGEPYQNTGDLYSRYNELKKTGMSEKEIAQAMGYKSTMDLRAAYSAAKNERRAINVATAKSKLADGKSQAQVAREMGVSESTLRSWLDESSAVRMNQAKVTADFLRTQIEEKGMIDVGDGVERELGISKEKLTEALRILEQEGYPVYGGGMDQVTNPGRRTNMKVICPPGTEHREIYEYDRVNSLRDYKVRTDEDGTEVFEKGFEYPSSLDSSRMMIRFRDDMAPDGHTGVEKDGTIELRRGVDDLSLGESHYAQVRIMVDGDKYLKGMAFYSDNMPDGVDVIFNTNKTPDQADKALKGIKADPDNPFGALIKENGGQYHYIDENGERKLGLVNKAREEGDWNEWSDSLPSQFLSKQSMTLIKKQLGMASADKQAEFDEIMSLTNPTVKKELLQSFADDCDSAAIHLQAAALPRQKYQVILPISTMADNEIYAPNYENGEKVALIRYPHGGTFEIPILTVNNKQPDGKAILGNTPADAVGINHKVAERLSGADFDGDTVMVIPCNSSGSKVKITSTPPLKKLEIFDAKMEYGYSSKKVDADGTEHYFKGDREFKVMKNTQTEMGKVSNLITDMTLKGATQDELARAVKHSMVVIDAEKHKLDWKQSETDNAISALKKKYQGRVDEDGSYHEGASTLISRSKGETQVLKRKGSPRIDPDTGEVRYKEVVEEYTDPKTGKTRTRTQTSTQMAETKDARTLSSGTPQEEAYADYANRMKALANQARKERLHTGKIEYSSSAKAAYQYEVDALASRLNLALLNAPREREAQRIANSVVRAKKAANPDMTRKEMKKAGQQALTKARADVKAKRNPIWISDREWDAIQAGAISENMLQKIIRNTDSDRLRQLATPRSTTVISAGKGARISSMRASGYTTAEIARAVGVSPTTVSKYLNGKE